MPDASTLQFLFQLARGIAGQFGPNCEVVVHDLASNDPESSIVAIENGHVTGRKVGDGPSHVVLEALRGDPAQLKVHRHRAGEQGAGGHLPQRVRPAGRAH